MLELLLMNQAVAALSGLLVGSISTPLAASRSVAFGLTLIHSILGGNLLGVYITSLYDLNIPIPVISTLAAMAFSIVVGELVERGFPEDTSVAFSVSLASTMTIIFGYLASQVSSLAYSRAWTYIAGTSAISSLEDLIKLSVALLIVAPVAGLLSKEFRYIAFDEEGAKAMGINVRFYRYTLYCLASISASILSSTIGVLATHIVLAIPGMVYLKFFKRFKAFFSIPIGLVVMLAGYFVAGLLSIPPSGGVGVISICIMAGVAVYGRLR